MSRWLCRVLVGAVVALGLALIPTQAVHADELPACAADRWVDGLAVERWDDDDFKVVLTPTNDARAYGTLGVYAMWHVVQACVPGLYDKLADSIYAQLACHADFSAVPDGGGDGFATGPTWDLESWRTAYTEAESIATKCSGYAPSETRSDPGEWDVYFGVDPLEKSEQEIAALRAQSASENVPAEQTVTVAFTEGVGLWTRTGPGSDAERITVLPEGTEMTLICQTTGLLVSDWIESDIWDNVRLSDGQEVYVSDVFVETGSNGQVAPSC
jgi:hypothetical protein